MIPAAPPKPSVASVLEGIGRWQQANPRGRQVSITVSGHRVEVDFVLMPSGYRGWIKFCSAYTAEEVVVALEDVTAFVVLQPDAEVRMSKTHIRFHEDTGEIEP